VKATALLAALSVGLMASMQGAAAVVMQRAYPNAPKPLKTAEPSRTVGSARNGGLRSGNRAVQRAALKARNVKRHRAHCKGRAHA
jgi:hypothetical protein